IDFVPTYSFEQLNEILAQNAEADLGLPKRLLAYLHSISQNNQVLSENIKRFPLLIHDTRGFAHAFLTNGGVSLKEVDPKTMRSKRVKGLSMCGELLDYNAYTGGFNITCALSTGYVAGKCCLDAD
ncbi:MAG TPA: NAD(P)/FAD-dependent oxidoreductase, partial [Erysipelothrix sp.]